MRRVLYVTLALAISIPSAAAPPEEPDPVAEPAAASPTTPAKPKAKRPASPADPTIAEQLDTALAALRAAAPGAPRLEAAKTVIALGPDATDAYLEALRRPFASNDGDRRALLKSLRFEVTKKDGRFDPPRRRRSGSEPKEPDWLAELAKVDSDDDDLLESIEKVTLLRALAATQREDAADAILLAGFDEDSGLQLYRDECGRVLRQMSPYSLPTLLRASVNKRRAKGAYGKYAMFQMDRLGKNRPIYALDAAPTDELEIAMLKAIQDVKHPDAVGAVLSRVDAQSRAVRKAAREAWDAYVTGPAPPEGPRKRRKLAGGKMSAPLPVYLSYRELALFELRRTITQVIGTEPAETATEEELTKQLFDHYDQRRAAVWDVAMNEAAELAKKGDWVGVGAKYDGILVSDPLYARRAEMVGGYVELGRLYVSKDDWDKAAVALNLAYTLDPAGPRAKEIEGELHLARAKNAQEEGETGGEELAQALAADPKNEKTQEAVAEVVSKTPAARPYWLLYAGVGGAAAALLLLVLGFVARKRSA